MPETHRMEGYQLISESAQRDRIHREIPPGTNEVADTIYLHRPPAQIQGHLGEAAGHPHSLPNQVLPLMPLTHKWICHFQSHLPQSWQCQSPPPGDWSKLCQYNVSPPVHFVGPSSGPVPAESPVEAPTPANVLWTGPNGPGPNRSRGSSLCKQTVAHLGVQD